MLKIGFKKHTIVIILILLSLLALGGWLRYENIRGFNLVFDFDQIEDAFYTYKITVDHQLPIIGRAIYGDPRLHHGVLFFYYNVIPFFFSGGDLIASAYWNSFFNLLSAVILFFLSKSIFGKKLPALLTAILAAVSFEAIKFAGLLFNETTAFTTVPLFYFGLWSYFKNKKWGLVLSAIFLGLSIESSISFIYLIPITLIFWLIFKPKIPGLKLTILSLIAFTLSVSTMILTEIKLNFSGVKTILTLSANSPEARFTYPERLNFFIHDFGKQFSLNLYPQRLDLGLLFAVTVILLSVYPLIQRKTIKEEKRGIYFLLLYLFSPLVTLILGYHQKPWFLIGLPGAIALITGYALYRLKKLILILPVLLLIVWGNTNLILARSHKNYELFDNVYDSTTDLNSQLQVIDFTYQQSNGEPFAINAVTYPLYYNGMWAYLYNWYGKNHFGYVPGWLGGDQLHPYDLLPKATNKEKYFYLLISETGRIPEVFKNKGRTWAQDHGKLIEQKTIGGFTVQKFMLTNQEKLD
ncbi:hypothetical protein M1437_04010 [Patescibacteria group bacterium]|nr:hypothetical protein [Patescibacteria group bacterium]MCL5785000.1 hypothetical protein [Patescibacteria group bacterium]